MGSGDWFKTIISRKKAKLDKLLRKTKDPAIEKSKESKSNKHNNDVSTDAAATSIQTAFRAYRARKTLRSLKGMQRLQTMTQKKSQRNQASLTLGYIQLWSKVQSQISARRMCMVKEGQIKKKKITSQLKIEAKLQDLEVEWCGGSETMEEIISRIQRREEAAVKRERAMAYAFSHQWRANSGQNQEPFAYEFGDGNWGWSWMERWIVARPWEARTPTTTRGTKTISRTKPQTNVASKLDKKSPKTVASVKPAVSNGNRSVSRLSYPAGVERKVSVGAASLEDNGSNPDGGPQKTENTC